MDREDFIARLLLLGFYEIHSHAPTSILCKTFYQTHIQTHIPIIVDVYQKIVTIRAYPQDSIITEECTFESAIHKLIELRHES
jgi:hypothetical protein